MGGKSTLLR
jgi:DNA mismatch repair protein MSH6